MRIRTRYNILPGILLHNTIAHCARMVIGRDTTKCYTLYIDTAQTERGVTENTVKNEVTFQM